MNGDSVPYTKQEFMQGTASGAAAYDPFVRGRFPVGVRTIQARDAVRDRLFSCEIWYPAAAHHAGRDLAPDTRDSFMVPPSDARRSQTAVRDAAAQPGTYPLIIFSHPSGTHRRTATFLCTHLSSHGYVVAALDHSEVVAVELASRDGETDEQRAERVEAVIANRVPDTRFLLDHLLTSAALDPETHVDPTRIGIVGHSFGGWTALAAPEAEPRIRAVVALAPAGSSRPKPGILPVTLTFGWGPIERRITGQRIWKLAKAVGTRAGIPALHPHALRHACGAELLRRTRNLRVVQEQLRHVEIQTITGYTRLTQQDVRQALETLDDEGE